MHLHKEAIRKYYNLFKAYSLANLKPGMVKTCIFHYNYSNKKKGYNDYRN